MNREEWEKVAKVGATYCIRNTVGFIPGIAESVYNDARKHGATLKFVDDYQVERGYYPCQMLYTEKQIAHANDRKCVICGTLFRAKSKRHVTCSPACGKEYARQQRTWKLISECRECGKEFTPKGNEKYCSEECRKRSEKRARLAYYHRRKAAQSAKKKALREQRL